jgi:hypothetical protein
MECGKKVVLGRVGGKGMVERKSFGYINNLVRVKIIISNVVMFMFTVNECQVKVYNSLSILSTKKFKVLYLYK